MSLDAKFQELLSDVIGRMVEPMGLDRWDIRLEVGRMDDGRAACTADPEYRSAVILFDPERLKTGDDVEEVAAHELVHCLLWVLHKIAEENAKALAELLPETQRAPYAKIMDEQVRKAAETATTDTGLAFLRLFRRLWKSETALATAKAEIKALKKVA